MVDNSPIQQDDSLRVRFLNILNDGVLQDPEFKGKEVAKKRIAIIGAGMTGLCLGHELKRAGVEAKIFELTERVGGRVKTIRLTNKQHAEAGAMRIPGICAQNWNGPSHYLTDFYVRKFHIPISGFANENPVQDGKNGDDFTHIDLHNQKFITNKFDLGLLSKHFPGWDDKIKESGVSDKITSIGSYWGTTTAPIKADLTKFGSPTEQEWNDWATRWGSISGRDFLNGRFPVDETQKEKDTIFAETRKYVPWPLSAILAFETVTYMPLLDKSMVEILRDDLGEWWQMPMYTIRDGMDVLPSAFINKEHNHHPLNKEILFGFKVTGVKEDKYGKLTVVGFDQSDIDREFGGFDVVINTAPLTVVRSMNFDIQPYFSYDLINAINGISYVNSTKVLVQFNKRFWEKKNLYGGFSKSDRLMGQLHYQENIEYLYDGKKLDLDKVRNSLDEFDRSKVVAIPGPSKADERGILVSYTWEDDAKVIGAMTPPERLRVITDQIYRLHKDDIDEGTYSEVGASQAWYNDEHTQGAFALNLPDDYTEFLAKFKPHKTGNNCRIMFAGEATSWSTGWIQGALESSLRTLIDVMEYLTGGKEE